MEVSANFVDHWQYMSVLNQHLKFTQCYQLYFNKSGEKLFFKETEWFLTNIK